MSKLKESVQDVRLTFDDMDEDMTYVLPQFNPFLMNPVKAVIRATGEQVGIPHTYMTDKGRECVMEFQNGTCSQALEQDLNIIEVDRFKDLIAKESKQVKGRYAIL